ncbi:hypothetical protein BC826DRAFT_74450 [Russula brevipes]|nr:hypothetical protein BC826DRAFT_74450 [Russula brevipes]
MHGIESESKVLLRGVPAEGNTQVPAWPNHACRSLARGPLILVTSASVTCVRASGAYSHDRLLEICGDRASGSDANPNAAFRASAGSSFRFRAVPSVDTHYTGRQIMAVVNRAAASGHGGILRSHPSFVMTIGVLALDFRNDGWEPNLSRFFAMTFREPNNVSSDFVVSMTAVLMKPP